MSAYADFLATKATRAAEEGRDVATAAAFPMLHDWQAEVVDWACRVGRAAIWADTGLGKTFMQIAWADQMIESGESVLIVAPLAICHQTAYVEAPKLGRQIEFVKSPDEIAESGAYITNYERLHLFDPAAFTAVVLDEASILKQSDGKMRRSLIEWARDVPYRLACTATPAPNDPEELTNQAEFLGHMTRANMLAAYFIHDQDGWRLKGHARGPMMRWMATWALAIRRPSDLGEYDDAAYDLPGVEIIPEIVSVDVETDGEELISSLGGVGGRAKMRRTTLEARCKRAAEIVAAEPDEPWLIWCGLNDEADLLARLTGGLNIHGSLSPEDKADGLLWFAGERCICGTPLGSKLPPWPRETTPSISGSTTPPTGTGKSLPHESGSRPMPNVGPSTCASTTNASLTSSSAPLSNRQSTTDAAVSGMPATPNTASASRSRRNGPPSSDERSCSARATESPSSSTTQCSPNKAEGAPSAGSSSATRAGEGSRSTTATTLGQSGVSCAPTATRASGSSETTSLASNGPSCTCGAAGMRPRILISKPAIASQGLNYQHCARMIFVGLSDSYEQYYQAIRRCHRYGQTRIVRAHIVLSEIEAQIATNVARKETSASRITDELIAAMRAAREETAA